MSSDSDCYTDKLMGKSYNYSKMIKTPPEMGVSPDGDKLSDNIKAMSEYSKILTTGHSNAQKNDYTGPLGNRYLIKTSSRCKDDNDEDIGDKHIYIDNIPKEIFGQRGLISGVMSDVNNIIPKDLTSITKDDTCQKVNLHTRVQDNYGVVTNKICEANLTRNDIKNINPCAFEEINGKFKNPITNQEKNKDACKEREAFITANDILSNRYTKINKKHINDNIENLYILGVGGLFIYLLYNVCNKV